MGEISEIQDPLIAHLRHRGEMAIKNTLLRRKGWPDVTCYLDQGLTIFWELKMPGEELDPLQAKTKKQLEAKGHTVFVAYSKDEAIEQFNDFVRENLCLDMM